MMETQTPSFGERVRRRVFTPEEVIPISGALSGFVSGVAVCPLDVAKTRLQLQGAYLYDAPKKTPKQIQRYNNIKYDGLIKTMGTIWREERFKGLYRGLVPITLGYFPSWMVYFTIYENCKKNLNLPSETASYFVSAVTLGLTSTTLLNPIWVVKTRLMLQTGNGRTIYQRFDKNFPNARDYYTSTWNCFKKMYRHEGLKSFYSGLLPSYLGLVHVLIHFPLYENFKKLFKCTNKDIAMSDSKNEILLRLVSSSALSKMIASGITYPHEILRTRLQIKNNGKTASKITLISTFKNIWKTQGVKGFYAGFMINLARTVPANAITLVSFDIIKNHLEKNFTIPQSST